MDSIRRAVIDVGTNSVKLLVAEVAGRQVTPVLEASQQTRLGQGFYATQELQPEPIARTAGAVAQLAAQARASGAVAVRVFATSAARDAKNPDVLCQAIQTAAGLAVEIISGDQEARWSFQGVTSAPCLADEPVLIMDLGGGSTEFILGRGRQMFLARSFPLGTVRELEARPVSNPPTAAEFAATQADLQQFLVSEVQPALATGLAHADMAGPLRLVGTGGTATLLGRMEGQLTEYDRDTIEKVRLRPERVRYWRDYLWSLSLEQRQQVPGLPANRADVILMGTAIYAAVMATFGLRELRVSTCGLRFAAVME